MSRPQPILLLCSTATVALCGCQQWFIDSADREVYRLIEQRQLAALGQTTDVRLSTELPAPTPDSEPYAFVPNPVTSAVPDAFLTGEDPNAESDPGQTPPEPGASEAPGPPPEVYEQGQRFEMPEVGDEVNCDELVAEFLFGDPFTLSDAFAYSIKHAREYQDAKEDLYLQALSLTLERHLWTPQFVSNLRTRYTEFPDDSDPDRALEAIADVAVAQRLPYGGELTAQYIGTMVRDLENHVTDTEAGTLILQADIPLLRGAGRVAYESRYQAERDLIYAVRRYARFRRQFLTLVASAYYNLLGTKNTLANRVVSRDSFCDNWMRSAAWAAAGRASRFDADRAKSDFLTGRNSVANTVEEYESDLDEFKILIGMDTTTPIDVTDEGLDVEEVDIDEAQAIDTAIALRLDLLNVFDQVDDARRGVEIAKNNLLPDLDFSGSVTWETDPDHLNAFKFREERETWIAEMDLEIPLDRKEERNRYRSSLIAVQRAQRNYELAVDRIRLEVRRALRRIQQAKFGLLIQDENIRGNELREEFAQIQFERGEIDNRDLTDAQNDLLTARDSYADQQAELRQAILGFRLATGTLRVGDDGRWVD